jgi:outer membrane protein
MFRTLKITVLILTMMVSIPALAQHAKFGYINSNDLLMVMPERDSAEADLQDFAKQLEFQLTAMTSEYEKKVAEYQQNQNVMNDLVKSSKEEEIMDLQRRIQEFQGKAQQSLTSKENELMEPLIKKAKDAISDVAKENKYTYIFDTSTGAVLHYPDGDNILPLVKKKLGIQ